MLVYVLSADALRVSVRTARATATRVSTPDSGRRNTAPDTPTTRIQIGERVPYPSRRRRSTMGGNSSFIKQRAGAAPGDRRRPLKGLRDAANGADVKMINVCDRARAGAGPRARRLARNPFISKHNTHNDAS